MAASSGRKKRYDLNNPVDAELLRAMTYSDDEVENVTNIVMDQLENFENEDPDEEVNQVEKLVAERTGADTENINVQNFLEGS